MVGRRASCFVVFALVGVLFGSVGIGGDAAAQAGEVSFDWSQLGDDIDGEAAGDHSGTSVAFSADGNRVAIGAPFNSAIASSSGHVRVLDWNGTAWVQVGGDIDSDFNGERSGISVALSSDGSRVAIGGILHSWLGSSDEGRVRVFDLVGAAWVPVGGDILGEAIFDQSGVSVTLSDDGSRVAVGALHNDGNGSRSGHVRVFDLVGAAWLQVGGDIDGEAANDDSGESLALSADGSRVAIGATGNDGNGSNAGHVRVFDLVGAAWLQVGGDIEGEATGDEAGASVALSADGSRVAVGATHNDDGGALAGHVRVFDLVGATWMQVGGDIDGEGAFDLSGGSVALSADGSRVAVGASTNDGDDRDSGHVRVFDLVGATWMQVGSDNDGEAATDQSATSMALSDDGSRLAIGAPLNDENGADAGHVRVLALSPFCDGRLVTIDMNLGASGSGTVNNDVILGTPGSDVIRSLGGDDTICAGDGNDVIRAGGGVDLVFGDGGHDTILGAGGGDTIFGGVGNDTIDGQGGTDTIFGGSGDDVIDGRAAADTIDGERGDDTINGQGGLDTIDGGLGGDTLRGQAGPDVLHGGNGDDGLLGGEGADTLFGGPGFDTCSGNTGPDAAEAATCETTPGVETLF